MTVAIDAARRYERALRIMLERAGAVFANGGRECRCPFHQDTKPSAGIFLAEDGVWRFKCQASACAVAGDVFDIQAKIEARPVEDILSEIAAGERSSAGSAQSSKVYSSLDELAATLIGRGGVVQIENRYNYLNPATGQLELVVFRCRIDSGSKTFRQASPRDGGWVMEAPPKPWPLYNREGIKDSDYAIVVEGEKCVEALKSLGFVATTNPAGGESGKALLADWRPLAGKRVWLWPDNDKPGRAHMHEVQRIIEQLDPPCDVWAINPDDLGLTEKQDAADYIETLCELAPEDRASTLSGNLSAYARNAGPEAGLEELIEDTIAGKRKAIKFPWPILSGLTMALMPGTVTLLCGSPGATKSFFLLQALAHWIERGVTCAVCELEYDRAFHLSRALAQKHEESGLANPTWIKNNATRARQAMEDHRLFMRRVAKTIFEAPGSGMTTKHVAEWIEERAKAGCRVIAVDPITAAENEEKPWIGDANFMKAIKASARVWGASILLVTHPKKGAGARAQYSMSDMAGGAAYERFSQTVFWLESTSEPEPVKIIESMGTSDARANRTVSIWKATNGKGTGLKVAFDFSGDSLRFTELGLMAPSKKKRGATA